VSERLDGTKVDPLPPELVIPREAWKILLERIQALPSTDTLAEKVMTVGAGGTVDLTGEEEAIILQVVRDWEHEVGPANLPSSIRELSEELRNFVLAYSRGGVEIQWESRNLLLQRLRAYPAAADIVTALETPDGAHPLRLTDEQLVVLRDVVARWVNEVGVSRLPPGISRLRGALEQHIRDGRRRGA
jgi:hypothetical protein